MRSEKYCSQKLVVGSLWVQTGKSDLLFAAGRTLKFDAQKEMQWKACG